MKIGFVSLGCPKNLVDTEVMLGLAEHAGHQVVQQAGDADVIVVNTCAFIDRAKEESIDTILDMARHKTHGNCRRLVVTGCLAERYRADLLDQMPEIDVVLGTDGVPAIVSAIESAPAASSGTPIPLLRSREEAEATATVAPPLHYLYDAETPRRQTTAAHSCTARSKWCGSSASPAVESNTIRARKWSSLVNSFTSSWPERAVAFQLTKRAPSPGTAGRIR